MRQHKICYLSSPDRGLEYLLFMWGDIKKEFPDAELHFAYGWNNFDVLAGNNPERMKWKETMVKFLQQPGIIDHGRLGKGELKALRDECGILAYPTDFFEIDCITVKECQVQGCVPVVMNFETDLNGKKIKTALDERIYAGVKVEGDIKTEQGLGKYYIALVELMRDDLWWKELSKKGKLGAKSLSWEKRAKEWTTLFEQPIAQPRVSIITPTIRKGFWHVMAQNIKEQTYKVHEWIIVDDYTYDRSDYADIISKKYDINIVYLRGKKDHFYHYGLSSANNIGSQKAEGDLLVFLQDFMFIPENGVEKLVDLYRRNPDALIAPVDKSYHIKGNPDTTKEDWFGGKYWKDVVGEKWWINIRCKGIGIRESQIPEEWEMNYGAVPKKIVQDLGGWYEFYNDGLGFDNTEFAYRALHSGYRILVDDTNIAIGLDHWEALKENQKELGEHRIHRLNDPRYIWMLHKISEKKLPLKRDKNERIKLDYAIPEELSQDDAVTWMRSHMKEIVEKWENI